MQEVAEDKVELEELIKDLQVKDTTAFAKYLIEIWRDLARRSQEVSKGIEKLTFNHYYDLPGIINDRLFNCFDKSGNKHLDPKEFVEGMTILFTGQFKDLSRFIFKFYDFNKDGYITKEDIRVVLSYVPLQIKKVKDKMKFEQSNYEDRVESQEELDSMLDKAFGKKEKLSEEDFVKVIDNVSSDIFIYILMYLLEKRPFSDETIALYPKAKSYSNTPNNANKKNHKIVSPSIKSKFMSPMLKKRTLELGAHSILGVYLKAADKDKGEGASKQVQCVTEGPVNNEIFSKPKRHNKICLKDLNDIHKMENTFVSHAVETNNHILDDDDDKDEENDNPPLIQHEGYMYKVTESKKLKKVFFKLVGKDFYYYKNKGDPVHKGMHNLSGIYIKQESEATLDGVKYYSFSITYPKKSRTYYIESEEEYKEWINKLNLAIQFKNLLDQFEIREKTGKGKFGLVKIGVEKRTGRKVAIKIMQKRTMNNQDLELAKTEIDILKVCQHPNIIKIYDLYETADYIYIIMEYCPGGDLFSYIEKRGYKLPEPRVADLIHKLCMAIYYVHSYGIVHRDLKPENILMTSKDENADIRLLDFGLSKIIGPTEKCTEPYGTLSYVAPEVLNEKPYGKEVDLWSIGIITYLLLCGFLPFDDETSEREIARQTIEDPVPYPKAIWDKLSKEARNFVDGLLQKKPKDRMNITQVLEHDWFKKYKKVPAARASPEKKGKSLFALYCANNE